MYDLYRHRLCDLLCIRRLSDTAHLHGQRSNCYCNTCGWIFHYPDDFPKRYLRRISNTKCTKNLHADQLHLCPGHDVLRTEELCTGADQFHYKFVLTAIHIINSKERALQVLHRRTLSLVSVFLVRLSFQHGRHARHDLFDHNSGCIDAQIEIQLVSPFVSGIEFIIFRTLFIDTEDVLL